MKPRFRVNVRCRVCNWQTSRAPKADGDYGVCRCGAGLVVTGAPRRVVFRWLQPTQTVSLPVPAPEPTRYPTHNASWPELVAAELERRSSAR